jgi:3-deoxy-D-manno-octulosonate 8-phosphate phosphatase (KDO 8-P phosphatase)
MTNTETTKQHLTERLAAIKLLVLDVDGVLTDGRIYYDSRDGVDAAESTVELQAFHARDGLGINLLRRIGVHVAWISGRGCAATRRRAEELGIEELHLQARGGKRALLLGIQERLAVSPDETAAMGDDIVDLAMARVAGLLACPRDAHGELVKRADFVAPNAGGRGAVRDLCDAILQAKGELQRAIESFDK